DSCSWRRRCHRPRPPASPSGPDVAKAQTGAFREWDHFCGERFADVKGLRHPTLVVQGFHDEMIPVRNSYWLAENLPNAHPRYNTRRPSGTKRGRVEPLADR